MVTETRKTEREKGIYFEYAPTHLHQEAGMDPINVATSLKSTMSSNLSAVEGLTLWMHIKVIFRVVKAHDNYRNVV